MWPAYRTVRELVHVHLGRAGVAIGGGDSAPKALTLCPADAIAVSANDHGFHLRACDYIVALDKGTSTDRRRGVPIISRHPWADYRIIESPAPSSGIAAAWLLRLMGCSPIYIIGMDCYQGGTYFHDPKAKSSGKTIALREHLARWRLFMRTNPADYRCIGGAIEKLALPGPTSTATKESLLRQIQGEFIQMSVAADVRVLNVSRAFHKGDVIEVRKKEAEIAIRQGKARRVGAPAMAA